MWVSVYTLSLLSRDWIQSEASLICRISYKKKCITPIECLNLTLLLFSTMSSTTDVLCLPARTYKPFYQFSPMMTCPLTSRCDGLLCVRLCSTNTGHQRLLTKIDYMQCSPEEERVHCRQCTWSKVQEDLSPNECGCYMEFTRDECLPYLY